VPNSIPHPFAGIARESLRSDPERRCTLSDVKARLEPARPLSAFAGRISRTIPAKLRRPALVAAALIVIAVIAVSRLQSDKTQPTPPTGEQQSGPAIAILPPQSPVPPEHNSRRAAVNDAIVEQVLPDVLPGASASIHGQISVKIRVAVDPAGHVSDAAFDSPGPSKYFAKAALQAAQRWRFKPAQVDSRAVSSVWILQFKFTQTATEVTPVEVSP
jgi:TonB family protein